MKKKIPNQVEVNKVSNSSLLPEVIQTNPNKKMVGSTLDVATSKGQLLPFNETYGLKTSSESEGSFFVKETDPARAESQTNISFVTSDSTGNYTGKTSYLDISNYFEINGLPLNESGSRLDRGTLNLDLPVATLQLTDYQQFYWVEQDLPVINIQFDPIIPAHDESKTWAVNSTVYSNGSYYKSIVRADVGVDITNVTAWQPVSITTIADNIIRKPFATVRDDTSGKRIDLQTGMRVTFTGSVDAQYASFDRDEPKVFYVKGAGISTSLIDTTLVDRRVPFSYLRKVPWDNSEFKVSGLEGWGGVGNKSYIDNNNNFGFDGNPPDGFVSGRDAWDSSQLYISDPEYIVVERYVTTNSHWSNINKWYHVGVIKQVAEFLEIPLTDIATSINQAQRPIIQFYGNIELTNWPSFYNTAYAGTEIYNVSYYFEGTSAAYRTATNLADSFGTYVLDGQLAVFTNESGIWQTSINNNVVNYTKISNSSNRSGATIIGTGTGMYYKIISNGFGWQLAQNKTSANQAPLFQFYNMEGQSVETIAGSTFTGAKILDFAEGSYYDPVLKRKIALTNVDFELVSVNNPITINSNQIKLYTDADATLDYNYGLDSEVSGPFMYNMTGSITRPRLSSFWANRFGIDFNKDVESVLYTIDSDTDIEWSSTITPVYASQFNEIHLYFSDDDGMQIYYNLDRRGLVRFTSKNSAFVTELFIPLLAGEINTIVLHNFPRTEIGKELDLDPIAFFRSRLITNTSELEPLTGVTSSETNANGVKTIELDLTNESDLAELTWQFEYNNSYGFSIVRSVYKWRFIYTTYYQDKTYAAYNNYDYTIDEQVNDVTYEVNDVMTELPSLRKKAKSGDKIIIESLNANTTNSKVAPISLSRNSLNDNVTDISYYAAYQHNFSVLSTSMYSREYQDPANSSRTRVGPLRIGAGTINKHANPLHRTAIMMTQLPYNFIDLLTKQGKHYDSFLTRLRSEVTKIVATTDTPTINSLELLNLALNKIYLGTGDNNSFWSHSNMIGWGDIDNRVSETIIADSVGFSLTGQFNPISHKAGQEIILHIVNNATGKLLNRNIHYTLVSDIDGYYSSIQFAPNVHGVSLNISQWDNEFESRVPASLSKIGLAPVYKPEILQDTSYPETKYFMHRHDGTRYYLNSIHDGQQLINDDDWMYPGDLVDAVMYEYEKAVWSSIAKDVEDNDFSEYKQLQPGGFRNSFTTWKDVRHIVNQDITKWVTENNLFRLANNLNTVDPFEFRYTIGVPDESSVVEGSWRAIYRFLYDTDRPHTHPWEMLSYTIKPTWWDTYYAWLPEEASGIGSARTWRKRTALETALRLGSRVEPVDGKLVPTPYLARNNQHTVDAEFPVSMSGELIPPNQLSWLDGDLDYDIIDWEIGDFSNYDLAYMNTQSGIASETKATFLLAPTQFVTNNWVPGRTISYGATKLDKTTGYWIKPNIDVETYHRSDLSGVTVYSAGIESLYSEFCVLNNIDFYSNVVEKFNNIELKKEFLLNGFTNKNNIRIQSTSITNQSKNLFVPEENFQVRAVKHYPHSELFYSGMRIVWTGSSWTVFGFTPEHPYFNFYPAAEGSGTSAIKVGEATIKQKNTYNTTVTDQVNYGTSFASRQSLYDFIIGYGKFLEVTGFKFEEPEAGDLRNWQLSAKQFIMWSNDELETGNYIDLNPAADEIIVDREKTFGQLDSLTESNQNPSLCLDRHYKPLFSNDLLVLRGDTISIKTKDSTRSIYGIKLTFSTYESVIHLDSTSVFQDVYFEPNLGTTKRSFTVGGKKSDAWSGEYFVPGYMFSGTTIIPNYDSMADLGRNLLNVENVINDSEIVDAIQAQFGLNRNSDLRQLFLTSEVETYFKSAITFEKGTSSVYSSLAPFTHKGSTATAIPQEEYMVLAGEMGNVNNINYYEFQLRNDTLTLDTQIIKFGNDLTTNKRAAYIPDSDWVYRPFKNNSWQPLSFEPLDSAENMFAKVSPIATNDADYSAATADDLPLIYKELSPLFDISEWNSAQSYLPGDKFRYNGKLYQAIGTIPAGSTWANISDMVMQVNEPMLPNIYVENYKGRGSVLLQLMDEEIAITECCRGIDDVSKARISTINPHGLSVGDEIFVVNASTDVSSVNGQWTVSSVEDAYKFYIDTRIINNIYGGKIFVLKSTNFSSYDDLQAALAPNSGYTWANKTADDNIAIQGQLTPSGFPAYSPIAIVENESGYVVYQIKQLNELTDSEMSMLAGASGSAGGYTMVAGQTAIAIPLKEQKLPVKINDIEQFLVYDHDAGETIAKIPLFDPKRMKFAPGMAEEIDSISRVDPGRYNNTTDDFKTAYGGTAWFSDKLGQRWWDTSTLQFFDYDTGSEDFKMRNWGKTLNNQLPDIYEWTKSTVPPSQYAELVKTGDATGEAYVDRLIGVDNYHWTEDQEYAGGDRYTVYYFWVKNKEDIEKTAQGKSFGIKYLSKVILNPTAAGISWYAPVSNNAMIVHGLRRYLNNTSTVVQIKKKVKGNEKSQQWILISDDRTVEAPEWLHIRMRDSLAGFTNASILKDYEIRSSGTSYNSGDVAMTPNGTLYQAITNLEPLDPQSANFENEYNFWLTRWMQISSEGLSADLKKVKTYTSKTVPDRSNLHHFNLLGNQIRPFGQSWFSDPLEARRTLIIEVNKLLPEMDMASIPGWNTRLGNQMYYFGDRTLDITAIWYYTDYVSSMFDKTKAINYVVQSKEELYYLTVEQGDYVKVVSEGTIYKIVYDEGFKGYEVVYRLNGSIQFREDIFARENTNTWDSIAWESITWDTDLSAMMSVLIDILHDDLFINQHKYKYKMVLLVMLRYVLSEQLTVDWLQKSSTIKPSNLIGENFSTPPELERDQTATLSDFFSNLKAYRDKLRDANIDKEINDPVNLRINDPHQFHITLTYDRVTDEVTEIEMPVNVSGINFDSTGSDNIANETLTGYKGSKYSLMNRGEEDVYVTIPDSMTLDVYQYMDTASTNLAGKVRMHQWKDSAEYFILDSDTCSLNDEVSDSQDPTMVIKLTNLKEVPTANIDNIQYIWIKNEKIGYTMKTSEGITGLIRGAHGTMSGNHSVTDPVYLQSGKTMLIKSGALGTLKNKAPFLNEPGYTLHESQTALADKIRNYRSS